jgi:hypothetical protein
MKKVTQRLWLKVTLAGVSLIVPLLLTGVRAPSASAVPSYSRQTGFPCRSCHTTPPELTPLGRQFKLNGYTITGMPVTKAEKTSREAGLTLLQTLPLSVFFETSYTQTNKVQPGTQNSSFEFPQDVSLFVAGAWSAHVGSFVQFTYSTQDNHFSWDQTDIRYANTRKLAGKDFVYGLMMNNTPGVEDLWHTTPAWGYPFIADDQAPTPAASTIIDGTLAQDVAGFGAYGMWNDHLYFATTMYRSEHLGFGQPNGIDSQAQGASFNIHGLAPYWRGAWQQTWGNNYLEVGTYGMFMRSTPNNIQGNPDGNTSVGFRDNYTDVAADFQYDRTIPKFRNDILSIRGIYIHENSSLNASASEGIGAADRVAHHLNTVKANVEYHFGDRYTGTVGWFNTSGTRDSLLYAPSDDPGGSANGSPSNSGYLLNLSWWPTQNIDLAAQYTGYFKFNGGSTNYNGSISAPRNASDNNTLYILARFIF